MGKKIEREGERLSRETGIDFKKYYKSGFVEKIGELIGFIGSIRSIFLGYYAVLLVIVTALCTWFFLRDMNIVGIVLFFIFGILFCAGAGTALATMKLAEKVVEDSSDTVVLMLDFAKEVRHDISNVESKPGFKIAYSDLLKGLSFNVFIPMTKQVIKDKLGLFSKPVIYIVQNALFYFTNFLTEAIDEKGGEISAVKTEAEAGKEIEAFDKSIDSVKEKIEPLADSVTGKLKIPARVLLILSIVICLPILLVIFLIF